MNITKTLLFISSLLSVSLQGQYCITGGPTQTADSNVEQVTLNGVSGGINYTGCPGVVGVEDLTANQQVTLNASSSYTANIQFGTCGGNYAGRGQAWIDYNRNQQFEPGESIGTWSGTPPVAIQNFAFTVPLGSTNGTTRMRVIQQEGAGALPLDPCAAFTWGSVTDFAVIIQGGTGTGIPNPYCVGGGPSQTADSNVEQVILNGVSGGIHYTGCPGIIGVEDSTATHQVTLNAGAPYTAFIKFGTCGGNFPGHGQAWIDYNGDQVFDATESIGTWQGTPPAAVQAFNFTVYAGAANGSTRMRVIQQEGASIPLDPCASFTWGSVVDFTVIIQGGIDCSPYRGNTKADAISVTTYPYADTGNTAICYTNASYVYDAPDIFYLAVLDTMKDSLKVSLCGSSFDTYLSIHNMAGDAIFYSDDYGDCAPQSEILFPTAGLDSVYIIVEGWGTLAGNFIINIDNDYVTPDVSVHYIAGKSYNFDIYPNPTRNILNIASDHVLEQILVYSIDGKQMPIAANHTNSVDISTLPAGIYILELHVEGHQFREKIVKQ